MVSIRLETMKGFNNISFTHLIILVIILIVISIVISCLVRLFSSPFNYPYFKYTFDVTGKRNPNLENLIEDYINRDGFRILRQHYEDVAQWKNDCEMRISNSKLKQLRKKQYESCIDDENSFCFYMSRKQTRYKQVNHVRIPYQYALIVGSFSCSYEWLCKKYRQLERIGFEANLRDYNAKNQRKLVTKQIRQQIAKRDNYTCKYCGKYMPDGVGLQIDHIIPIAKGGKTVSSNLQVLCSKCNGSKSAKIIR